MGTFDVSGLRDIDVIDNGKTVKITSKTGFTKTLGSTYFGGKLVLMVLPAGDRLQIKLEGGTSKYWHPEKGTVSNS